MKKMRKLNNKGFSLVELIIVIAIMAVLVGVLAPQFTGYVGKGRKSTDVQNAQQIATDISVQLADKEGFGTATDFAKGKTDATSLPTGYAAPDINHSVSGTTGTWYYKTNADGDVIEVGVMEGTTEYELFPDVCTQWQ